MKIYTKTGDDGTTGLLYGGRVRKGDLATEAYGTVDEAVAVIGLARSFGPQAESLDPFLLSVQRMLFIVGAELATAAENAAKLKPGVSKVTADLVETLEKEIDRMTSIAPLPDYFIVPGATRVSAALDTARAIVRRGERAVVRLDEEGRLADSIVLKLLNRLSDYLFTAARFEEHATGIKAPASRED